MKRNVYLDNMPLEEALRRWFELCRREGARMPLDAEEVPAGNASGRVTARPLFARVSSPPFHSSAMDGIAVRASDTFGASEANPIRLELEDDAELVDTGEPIPEGFDAVIMVEDLKETETGVLEIEKPAFPWQNVRPLGEDLVASELVVPQGHRIRPVDIGALLNAGYREIPVLPRPVVTIIPTGSELVEDPGDLGDGKVMESNSWTLAAYAEELGARAVRWELVPDEPEAIALALEEALETSDIIVVNAGTSAGREDYTRSIIERFGKVAVHGVAIRPGKPVILGVAKGRPVVGLPGFPVANYRGAEEFLRPMIMEMMGLPPSREATLRARLARKVFSAPGFDEFLQVKIGRVGEEVVAVPLPRGSGVSMSLVRSDGVVRIPGPSEGLSRWEKVEVLLYRRDIDIDGTILAVGSHDVSLDLLASRVKRADPRLTLASANVGSMGGIMAIKNGQAHVAGTHLLDPETGEFNVPYVLRQLSREDALLVHLAWRTQGLMVVRGNPKGIGGIEDLAAEGVSFVNRQKGSGTRLLLDHLLGQAGIDSGDIDGYGREMFTHTAVAAAVAGGAADVGLGLLAAARALELDFIPLAGERYDLLVAKSFKDTPGFEVILEALGDAEYRKEVEALGGYDLSGAGEIIPVETE